MSHLTLETLARLVDEAPGAAERSHLDRCAGCRDELDAMVEQRRMLARLPALAPAPDRWPELRRRLRAEGLVRPRRRLPAGLARAAAAAFLFLAGGAIGYGVRGPVGPGPVMVAGPAASEAVRAAAAADPARDVEAAGEAFLHALDSYMSATATPASDPAARLAALDHIVITTAEALSESPADPVLSSYHLTALAQREAVLRQITASAGRPVF